MKGLEHEVRSYKNILKNSVLAGAVSLSLFAGGCKKQEPVEHAKQPMQQKTAMAYERDAEKELDLANHRANVLLSMIDYYRAAGEIIKDDASSVLFNNSIEKTLAALEKWKGGLVDGWSLSIPVETYELLGVQRYGNIFQSDRYWDDLKEGMNGFGFLQSGIISTNEVVLLAKEFYPDYKSFPKDARLITTGEHRGFLVNQEGDLVVPGFSFYINVKERDLDISTFKTAYYYRKNE